MEILNKLQALSESLGQGKDQVEQVKSDVEVFGQAKFDEGKLAGIEEGKILGFEEGKKVGYDEGFAAGVASVPVSPVDPSAPVSDKIYSQAELDEKIVIAKAEKYAELKQKYQDAQAAESSIEAAVFQE